MVQRWRRRGAGRLIVCQCCTIRAREGADRSRSGRSLERFRAGLSMGIGRANDGANSRERCQNEPGERRAWVDRADALLVSLGARSGRGWRTGRRRGSSKGSGVSHGAGTVRSGRCVAGRVAPLENLRTWRVVEAHDEARAQADRAARAVMALRLARWITTETTARPERSTRQPHHPCETGRSWTGRAWRFEMATKCPPWPTPIERWATA